MKDDLPDKDRFVEEQRKDPYCSTLKPGKRTGKADFFWMTMESYRNAEPIINTSWWCQRL